MSATLHNRTAWLAVALLVPSHWVLDWITHRPDLPLVPGGARYGLGLWNSVLYTLGVELLLFGVGVLIYCETTKARDRIGDASVEVHHYPIETPR